MLHLYLKKPQIRLSVMCGKRKLIYSPLGVHFHLIAYQFHMFTQRGYPLSVVAVSLLCGFLLTVFSSAGFHARDLPCFATKTKTRKLHMNRTRFHEISLGHQHGWRFFVLWHQHGHRDAM